jgi:hypothetical protein
VAGLAVVAALGGEVGVVVGSELLLQVSVTLPALQPEVTVVLAPGAVLAVVALAAAAAVVAAVAATAAAVVAAVATATVALGVQRSKGSLDGLLLQELGLDRAELLHG